MTGWLNYLSNAMKSNDEKSFYYGCLSHVAADVFAHTYVNQYSGNVFSLFDNETLVERRHIALEGYIDAKTPPFKNENNQIIADTAASIITLDDKYGALIRDKLIYNDDVYNQYKKSPSAVHLVGYKAFRDEVDSLANNTIWNKIDKLVVRFAAEYCYNVELSDEDAGKLLKGFQPINEVLNGKIPD
ncbi:zinc dependent phospholipase C family protein [Photobacterium sanguinicancri]|uniref:zinc dependent phospholipase C family protein n=1 Tax=Photobacterium sanguinicancri TaxID=875932 RepID=UPI0026E2B021|nr:zinc dependent phospholipase C family protein [Photobacterium sanguinicancri]MDO6498328.1 zinc dependent phospholipase C family protein [Photobacterium sanguinicancri]